MVTTDIGTLTLKQTREPQYPTFKQTRFRVEFALRSTTLIKVIAMQDNLQPFTSYVELPDIIIVDCGSEKKTYFRAWYGRHRGISATDGYLNGSGLPSAWYLPWRLALLGDEDENAAEPIGGFTTIKQMVEHRQSTCPGYVAPPWVDVAV